MRIGLLASGELGFVLLEKLNNKRLLEFVFTDSKSTEVIGFANKNNIPTFVGNPRKGKSLPFIQNKNIDILLSVNYLFLIENDLISLPRKYPINIHGSLLPKYRGRTPHIWAIINNEKKTGITAHIIDNECDTGDIIAQREIPILDHYTGNDLLNIYFDK